MTEEKRSVKISIKLYVIIQEKVDQSQGEFTTVDEYIEFILLEVLDEGSIDELDQEDEEIIKERLRKLGYI